MAAQVQNHNNNAFSRRSEASKPETCVIKILREERKQVLESLHNLFALSNVQYLPYDSFVVATLPHVAEQIADVSGVLGVFFLPSEMKISPDLLVAASSLVSGNSGDSSPPSGWPTELRVIVTLQADEVDSLPAAWRDELRQAGLDNEVTNITKGEEGMHSLIVAVEGDGFGSVLKWLSKLPEVMWIEQRAEVVFFKIDSAEASFKANSVLRNNIDQLSPIVGNVTGGQPSLWAHGLDGRNEVIGIMDTGLDFDNCAFSDGTGRDLDNISVCVNDDVCKNPGRHRKVWSYRRWYSNSIGDGVNGHGTHVTGSAVADTNPNSPFQLHGIAPAAKVAFEDGQDATVGNRWPGPPTLFGPTINEGIVKIHSNSWGQRRRAPPYPVNEYNSLSSSVDKIMFDNDDYLIVFAAGNDGPGYLSISAPATSKNAISVGASENVASAYRARDRAAFLRYSYGAVTGRFGVRFANFGGDMSEDDRKNWKVVAMVSDEGGSPGSTGCGNVTNVGQVRGNLALILRGSCPFQRKCHNAEQAGAVGCLIANNVPNDDSLLFMGFDDGEGPVTIPSMAVSTEAGDRFGAALDAGAEVRVDLPFFFNPLDWSPENPAYFSARGPTMDMRIKPDVVAIGENVLSARSDNNLKSDQCFADSAATVNSGTSMACPMVSGAAAIVRQYFLMGYHHSGAPNPSRGFSPSAALVKAVILHSGQKISYPKSSLLDSSTDTDLFPNFDQGYGSVDLPSTLWLGEKSDFNMYFVDRQNIADQAQFGVCVHGVKQSSNKPLKVTLHWTDPPALPHASHTLIHDLDLSVTHQSGVAKFGNALPGVSTDGTSASVPLLDNINNNEQVTWEMSPSGDYQVVVTARDVPMGAQNFSLVVTGMFSSVAPCASPIICPGGGQCSGNGECLANGVCRCKATHAGADCSSKNGVLSGAGQRVTTPSIIVSGWAYYTFFVEQGDEWTLEARSLDTTMRSNPDLYLAFNRTPSIDDFDARDVSAPDIMQFSLDSKKLTRPAVIPSSGAAFVLGINAFCCDTAQLELTLNITSRKTSSAPETTSSTTTAPETTSSTTTTTAPETSSSAITAPQTTSSASTTTTTASGTTPSATTAPQTTSSATTARQTTSSATTAPQTSSSTTTAAPMTSLTSTHTASETSPSTSTNTAPQTTSSTSTTAAAPTTSTNTAAPTTSFTTGTTSAPPATASLTRILLEIPAEYRSFSLNVNASSSVKDVKKQIAALLGFSGPLDKLFLFLNGRQLTDDRTLASYSIAEGDAVQAGFCSTLTCTTEELLNAPRACKESDAQRCHASAYCEDFGRFSRCICPEGSVGDGVAKRYGGSACSRESWALQISIDLGSSAPLSADGSRLSFWERDRAQLTNLLFVNASSDKPTWFDTSVFHMVTDRRYATFFALFITETEADAALLSLLNNTAVQARRRFDTNSLRLPPRLFGANSSQFTAHPRVSTFVSKTSDSEIRIMPTGMDVQNVYFRHDCFQSGCWVIDLIYTAGEDNFNVFYLPKAVGNDTLSYDFDYTAIPPYAAPYGKSPADTFLPLNFPCGSDGYKYKAGAPIQDRVSACCIEEFTEMYRPVDTFLADPKVAEVLGTSRDNFCDGNATRPTWSKLDMPGSALFGNFSGMDGLARVDFKMVEDPYLRQFTATVRLDEVTLRQRAGKLAGSVGIAHSIDTFIGFANFKPTGLEFVDMFAAQTAIHLEKTSFFTVSAHGENQFTFLEYVNLRLVAIYKQDSHLVPSTPEPFTFDEYHLRTAFLGPYPESAAKGNTTLAAGSQVWVTEEADGSYRVYYHLLGLAAAETQGGIRVHEGTSCDTHEQVLGPFFSTPVDPWTTVWTKAVGETVATGSVRVVNPGFALENNDKHAFVVYEQNGNRIACGTLYDVQAGLSRTSPQDAAHYLQVTFTLGEQYQPIETGIVPIDSVLVSKGDFITSAETLDTRFHACQQYHDGSFPQLSRFNSRFPTDTDQTCAPNATMCYNPPFIPDQFVHFNIPLGIDWLPTSSNNLDSNVFVDLVVSVIDAHQIAIAGGTPNNGDPAEQMKTTLTASIPVVEGGVYIFCDKITVKEDLLDVANADLILGSAGYDYEFSRLRILKDIATTPWQMRNATNIDSDSIEAGLMTLVVKGNESYFARSTGFALQVEDVITIHVMEPETGTKYDQVLALLFTPGSDTSPGTDGFALNGAFQFSVDRAQQSASLEPTAALDQLCPFSPQRPNPADAFPETCVTRRDIRARGFPALNGKNATAIELPPASVGLDDIEREDVARFMQLVLNPSDYSAQLGRNFSYIVGQKYNLNSRYNRAFWINPGYEWSPTQTGGQDIFTLSQKIVLFALINLDEGFTGRRRMLLQSANPTQNTGAGVSGQQVTFDTTPQSMMANLYNIPEDLVAIFKVEVQLSFEEACMSPPELRRAVRATLDEYVAATASHYETVQVLSVAVEKADVQCNGRRAFARKLQSYSAASASMEMMVVFSPSDFVAINLQKFASMMGVNSVSPLAMSDLIHISTAEVVHSEVYTPQTPGVNTDTVPAAHAPLPEPSSSKSTSVTVVAACIGAGATAFVGGYWAYNRRQRDAEQEVQVLGSLSVDIPTLKAEIALP